MRSLNRRFHSRDAVTDVLAFPLGPQGEPEGEIYVNLDRAYTQARAFGATQANETRRLIIHGLLHLVGYRDAKASDKRRMRAREEFYLDRLAHT